MSRYFKLLKIDLTSMFNLNKLKKNPPRLVGTILLIIFCVFSMCISVGAYMYALAAGLKAQGMLDAFPELCIVISVILSFTFSLINAQNTLFSFKDFDTLSAMPIKPSIILASKVSALFLIDYVFCFLILLPSAVVYFSMAGISMLYMVFVFIAALILPVLPSVLASIAGFLISYVLKHVRFKNLLSSVLSFALLIGVLLFFANPRSIDSIQQNASGISGALHGVYPLAPFFASAFSANPLPLIVPIILSVGVLWLFSIVFGKLYQKTYSVFSQSIAKSNYKMKSLKVSGGFSALFKKELKMYLKTPVWVLNTAFGPVILLVFSVASLFTGANVFTVISGDPQLAQLAPFVVLGVVCFCLMLAITTCSSISLEGKSIWIIKSLPIDIGRIFNAKIAVSLLVSLPALAVSLPALAYGLKLSLEQTLVIFAAGLLSALCAAFMGLWFNLVYPKLDWTAPMLAVKQSASVLVSTFLSMGIMVTFVPVFIFVPNFILCGAIVSGILLMLCILFFALVKTKGAKKFARL